MYSFGMIFRVCSLEVALVICNFLLVASFLHQLCWGLRSGRPIESTKDYMGYIEEILESDYRSHCSTFLVCDCVCASRNVYHLNIERDTYSFIIANSSHMDGNVHVNLLAFPLYFQQVFFQMIRIDKDRNLYA